MESGSETESETQSRVPSFSSLPDLSKKKYEAAYKLFMEWIETQPEKSYSEEVLMTYFAEIAKKFKSSTLWTHYSMLRTTLKIHDDVEIIKYLKLRAFLKRQAYGYRPKKSKTFTSTEIYRFITEAPDKEFLLVKVALIMGVLGACSRHELHQMKTTDIKDTGTVATVSIYDNRTKAVRKFNIEGELYEIFKKYASLRPLNVNNNDFFLNYQKEKCTVQKVGINKFGAMGKQIAQHLQLPNPESYTGHCFRRSSGAIMDNVIEVERSLPSYDITYISHRYSQMESIPRKVNNLNMVPDLSRKKYETAYKIFEDWQKKHDTTSHSESVLLSYFGELAKRFKSSTLWTIYSMLRTTLNINHGVDIVKYSKLRAFLRRQAEGYKPKKSKTFSSSEIHRFITEAPDKEYLLVKVALIMGVMGACTRHELHQMRTSDLNDKGSSVTVTIFDHRTNVVRKFTIEGPLYQTFKKYYDLRPPNVPTSHLFLNYQKEKCTIQKVGINKFGAMGKQIAKYLRLPNPESYTGHCFRRSSGAMINRLKLQRLQQGQLKVELSQENANSGVPQSGSPSSFAFETVPHWFQEPQPSSSKDTSSDQLIAEQTVSTIKSESDPLSEPDSDFLNTIIGENVIAEMSNNGFDTKAMLEKPIKTEVTDPYDMEDEEFASFIMQRCQKFHSEKKLRFKKAVCQILEEYEREGVSFGCDNYYPSG